MASILIEIILRIPLSPPREGEWRIYMLILGHRRSDYFLLLRLPTGD